ncbi:MAG: hypothetical protein KKF62_17965 [Bacteroidetes bacterium]|nr:hypothetical protein [Bacteroidota bacterium]MBU1115317.1 hypothetical protein [Bacteroidota bacterium]MBU1800363.1 hypothetical protein [Bacteroidota bacterium]
MKNEKILFYLLILFIGLFKYQTILCQVNNSNFIPEGMNMESRIPDGSIPMSVMDLTKNQAFTGSVSIPIKLLSLGGVEIIMNYNSNDILSKIGESNNFAPSGAVGFGWDLSYGSISAEINNTTDINDDRYYYNGPDQSFEIQVKSDGTFNIPDYKPWKFNRIVVNNIIVGWEIIKEDGTIYRYGNYDKDSGSTIKFVKDYYPTYATRFMLGYNGVVTSPGTALFNSLEYVPYQWDISNVEDLNGNQTTITYQQENLNLSLGASTSSLAYTRQSFLHKINDNRGGEVEFVLGNMLSDEYYNYSQTYIQNRVESKYLDSIYIKGNDVIFKKIDFEYIPLDIKNIGIKKRYLTNITYMDNGGNSLPSYKFDYYTQSSDLNKGALKSLTDLNGGISTYTYKTQQLADVILDKEVQVPYIDYYNNLELKPNDDGFVGKDFVVVHGTDHTLQVYVKGANGWYIDNSFPYSTNILTCKVSNDFMILDNGTYLIAVKKTEGGWKQYIVDNYISPNNYPYFIVGMGSNYFVVEHNQQGNFNVDPTWDVSILRFSNNDLETYKLVEGGDDGLFNDGYAFIYDDQCEEFSHRYVSMRAFCGENYMVLVSRNSYHSESLFSHFQFSSITHEWDLIGETSYDDYNVSFDLNSVNPHKVYIGKNVVLVVRNEGAPCTGSMFRSIIYEYRRNNTNSGLTLIDSVETSRGMSDIILTDDYYAYTYKSDITNYNQMAIRVWNGTSFSSDNPIFISNINTSTQADLESIKLATVGNRLVISWVNDNTINVGSIEYNPTTSQWINGQTFNQLAGINPVENAILPLNNNTFLEFNYISTIYGWGNQTIRINAYQYQGSSFVHTAIDTIKSQRYERSQFIWQAGNDFLAFGTIGGTNLGFGPIPDSLRIYNLNDLNEGELQFRGSPTKIVLDHKSYNDGMGNVVEYDYTFDNGILNENNNQQFGIVTKSLPGSNGSIETKYYTCKDSIVSGINYKFLAGTTYNVKEKNSSNSVVRETQKSWTLTPIDEINGVYYDKLESESVIMDGVTNTSSFDYNSAPYCLLTKKTETNSNNLQRITDYKYAYEKYPAMDASASGKHMLSQLYSKTINKGTSDVEAKNWTIWSNSDSYWRPREEWLWKGDGSSNDLTASVDPDGEAITIKTYNVYDDFGNIKQTTDGNLNSTTTKWAYNNLRPTAVIKNANTNECGYASLEDGWEDWESGGSSISTSAVHSGISSSYSNNDYGPTKYFYVTNGIDKNKTYIFEAWVKNSSGNATINIVTRNSADQDIVSKSAVSDGVSGWQHISVEITPEDMTSLPSDGHLRVFCGFIGAGNSGYIDDIRFYPADAEMVSFTYNPITLQPTSSMDANSIPIYYTFDEFQRLSSIKDHNYNLLEKYEYYYSRLGNNDDYILSDPNYVQTKKYLDGSTYSTTKVFTDGLGQQIQTRLSNGSGSYDQVSFQQFDELNRVQKAYKPYFDVLGSYTSFSPYTQAVTEVNNWYNGTNGANCSSYPYTQTEYYPDPLNRVSKIGNPGNVYRMGAGKEIEFVYNTNSSDEVPGYKANTGYAANALYKKMITDENGNVTYEFTDKFGQKVLNRTVIESENLDTYFEYDVLGNLTKTVPPNGEGFNTTYAYNTLGQLIKKSTPDEDGNGDGFSTDEVSTSGTPDYEYKYDKVGNLRFVLDPNGRNAGYFTYNKYDAQNRIIETGKKTNSAYFTETNALNKDFPTDGEIITANCYDAEPTYGNEVWINAVDPGTMNNLHGKLSASAYKDMNTEEYGYTYYSYNQKGNIELVVQDIPGSAIGVKKIAYEYDLSNNLTKVLYQSGQSDQFHSWYEYDAAGRLQYIYTNTSNNRSIATRNAEYVYNPTGQFKRIVYGETAQGVDYLYNTRDWVTQINHQNLNSTDDLGHDGGANGVTVDRFGMVIGYDNTDPFGSILNPVQQYNGNISWMMWTNFGLTSPNSLVGYSLGYDKANRLLSSDYAYWTTSWQNSTAGDVNNLTYDKNGNIQSLTRYGLTSGLMDQFTYRYDGTNLGNKLKFVDDASPSSNFETDIDDQSVGNYTYDGNGNLKTDLQKNITSLDYDIRNLQNKMNFGLLRVLKLSAVDIDNTAEYKAKDTLKTENNVTIASGANVTFKAGAAITLKPGFSVASGAVFTAVIDANLQNQTIGSTVKYVYDAQGNRVKKDYSDYSSEKYYIRDASGNVIAVYDENGNQSYMNLFGADGFGKYVPNEGYSYYIKDHLGSTRVVVDETGTVMEAYEYYPFGRISRSYINGTGADEKFTGKELDNDNDERMYYFGARYLDSDLGKWLSVDPLADKYPGLSSYSYAGCNPINRYDPDGKAFNLITGAIGAGVGLLIGAGAEAGRQYFSNEEINFQKISAAGLGGGLAGGLAGLTLGGSLVASGGIVGATELVGGALISGAATGTGGIVERALDGDARTEAFDGTEIVTDVAVGTFTSFLGPLAGAPTKTAAKETEKLAYKQFSKNISGFSSKATAQGVAIQKGANKIMAKTALSSSSVENATQEIIKEVID